MTTLFVDCEFNGFGGELMSMALVSDDGREWYEVRAIPATLEPWVAENVVPVLGKPPVGGEAFRASLHAFLRQFSDPLVVADWYTDLVHFFSCFAGRHHAESILFPCRAALRAIDYVSAVPHNALEDARAIARSAGHGR